MTPLALRVSCFALACCTAGQALAQTTPTPFPTDEAQLPRHCLAVATGASAVGRKFTENTRAVPLAEPGEKLYGDVLASGAFSREELGRMQTDQTTIANDARAFLDGIGVAPTTRNPTNEAVDVVASHLTQCQAWLVRRPPVLVAMPKDGQAMGDHCVAAAAAAQNLGSFKGNRSGQTGALATRVARNARDVLDEAHRSGIRNPATDRERLKPPEGDLYLQGMDLLLALKMANPGPIEALDVRGVRMLDGRIRACHKSMGLQMPLE